MTTKDPFSRFDLEDPDFPQDIEAHTMSSGGYPYEKKLKRRLYEHQLESLQRELVKVQTHLQTTGERVVVVFEGRDAAGKGGTIKRYMQYLNPRAIKNVALPKPSDREKSTWYFQRYVEHLPSAGETVLFDRSWYNRAGVEPVMGFCTLAETAHFLVEAPRFEHMLVDDGIHFFKFWLDLGRDMQLKRFHARRHNPLKVWKLSPIDLEALARWDDYTRARNTMLPPTDTDHAPWTVVRANDKRRARLNLIRHVLTTLDYGGKDIEAVGNIDPKIVLTTERYLAIKG